MRELDWSDLRRRRLTEDLHRLGLRSTHRLSPDFEAAVLYAMHAPPHEAKLASFGAITPTPYAVHYGDLTATQLQLPLGLPYPLQGTAGISNSLLWQMADGYSSVVLLGPLDAELVSTAPPLDELECLRMSMQGYSTVQRLGTGDVRIVLPEMILNHDSAGNWTVKPHFAHVRTLSWYGAPPLEAFDWVMRIALHRLSGTGVGATFVVELRPVVKPEVATFLDFFGGEAVGKINLEDPQAAGVMRSLAAQNDRAMLISSAGDLTRARMALTPDQTTPHDHVPFGGTRHTSALQTSAEADGYVIIVVSEDGPVSVMADGRILLSIRNGGHCVASCFDCDGVGHQSCTMCDGEGLVALHTGAALSSIATRQGWERDPWPIDDLWTNFDDLGIRRDQL